MAVNNNLAKRPNKTSLTAYLTQDAVKNQINSVVGGKNGTRFMSSIVSAVQATPTLQECTNSSILSAALLGESLNLSPSPQLGQFYLVPYDNRSKGAKEAQFQLGYKGYIQLAIRSGQYKKLNVLAIKEKELVRFDPLNEEIEVNLIEDENEREETKTIGYYAMFEYTNGFRKALYWSREKMEAHAKKYSPGYKKDLEKGTQWTFWAKDFDGMAYKTMLRQLISKWGIMSIDLIQAIDADMAVIREDGTADYVEMEETPKDNVVAEQEPETSPVEMPVQESEKAPETSVEDDFFNQ
ncbi:recombinase RecT [Lacrimispora sp.]|uniref:recombinase RecT n=1 Tax=Lacrimispora sp. TaxID=2719234 RepID=UPI0028AF3DE8|nr:recombinase RecT [Lacrimispora sp.]